MNEKEWASVYYGYGVPLEMYVYTELEDENFSLKYREAIIRELIANDYVICGDTHQNICLPVFEDNYYVMLSMRTWSEIMAEAQNIKEKTKKYTYMDFYMACSCPLKEKLPHREK